MALNTQSIDWELSSSQFGYVTDNADVSPTGDITIECWLKPESFASASINSIISKAAYLDGKRSYFTRFVEADGTATFLLGVSDDGGSETSAVTTTTFPTGSWVHIAVTYDSSAGTCKFYKDGVYLTGEDGSSLDNSIHDNDTRFQIGAIDSNLGTPGSYFDGKGCYYRLWNDIRSGAEIAANWKKSLIGTEDGLVGNWKFNGDATDSAKSSDLTLSGSPNYSNDVPFSINTPVLVAPNQPIFREKEVISY